MNTVSHLRDLFKGKEKKALVNVSAAFIVGVLLLISSNILFTEKPDHSKTSAPIETSHIADAYATLIKAADVGHEQWLESRLEDILSRI